jgi:hypothetical protein
VGTHKWCNGITVYYTAKQDKFLSAKITEAGCSPVYSDVRAAYVDRIKTLTAKLINGKITSTATDLTKLRVFSMIDSTNVKSDGSFDLLVADSTSEELLLVYESAGAGNDDGTL